MDTAPIQIRDLRVTRGGRLVLPGLSMRLDSGTVTGLLGPSGSGKSTLIRSIVGVQRIDSGTVKVLGYPAGSRAAARAIGYMTQASSVYVDLTVHENVVYWARISGARTDQAESLIEQLHLGGLAGQLAGRLSGGQASRVALACALVGNPPILVLDEPTVGLDPVLREEIWDFLRERADSGTTILVSSHVMDEAARCDNLLLIRQGEILASGDPKAICERTNTSDLDAAFLSLIRERAA